MQIPCGRKGEFSMDCTEAYKEHIMYSFNGFCKVVIRYAAINAWRDRNRWRQKEISFEYLTEEKFYPLIWYRWKPYSRPIPGAYFSGIGNQITPTPGIKRRHGHLPHPFRIRRTLLSCRQSGEGVHKGANLWSRVEHRKRKLPVKRDKCDMQSTEKDRVGQLQPHLHKDCFRHRLQVYFRGITTG